MTFKDWWTAYFTEWQEKGRVDGLSPYDAAKAAYEAGRRDAVENLTVVVKGAATVPDIALIWSES